MSAAQKTRAKTREKVEDIDDRRRGLCPVGEFFGMLEDLMGRGSDFRRHMLNSRKEFLTAIKSLLEDRIEAIDKEVDKSAEKKSKLTKIKVEAAED
jgi:hypothetical protein